MCDNCARANIAILAILLAGTPATPYTPPHIKHTVDLGAMQPFLGELLRAVAVDEADLTTNAAHIAATNEKLVTMDAELLSDTARVLSNASSLFEHIHGRLTHALLARATNGDVEARGHFASLPTLPTGFGSVGSFDASLLN